MLLVGGQTQTFVLRPFLFDVRGTFHSLSCPMIAVLRVALWEPTGVRAKPPKTKHKLMQSGVGVSGKDGGDGGTGWERRWDSQEPSDRNCSAVIMIKIWSTETALRATQTGHGILIRAQLAAAGVCTSAAWSLWSPFGLFVVLYKHERPLLNRNTLCHFLPSKIIQQEF